LARQRGGGVEVEVVEGLGGRQPRLFEMTRQPPALPFDQLGSTQSGEVLAQGRMRLLGLDRQRLPLAGHGGETKLPQQHR
jgi:hypothetical protein